MTYYIYSTLATDMRYTEYQEPIKGQKVSIVKHAVLVHGRAGVADKHLVTPRGVVTKVSDEDYAMLAKNDLFKLHQDNGYIKSEKKQSEVDKVIVDMKERDVSAPITPEFYDKAPEDAAKPDAKSKRRRRA
jgi:hypothetical protein